MGQVTEQETKDLEGKLSGLETFLKEKTEEQSKVSARDEAVFSSQDVANEIKGIGNLLKRLLKKAPLPPPEEEDDEEVKTNTTSTNATDTNTTEPEEGKSEKDE